MNKQFYLDATKDFLAGKIFIIQNALKDTQASANSETKSSAGDKHETSRAMAQIENERLAGQLANLLAQVETLYKINPTISSEIINFGSVVKTDSIVFFISTGIGKVAKNETTFLAIATNSPIGMALLGKTKGDVVIMGNKKYRIYEVE